VNIFRLVQIGATGMGVIGAYFYGYHQGMHSEELRNARIEISALQTTVEKYRDEQDRLSTSLADIRVSESHARDESEWMRKQLSDLERRSKTNANRERNRCLRLATEGKELLDRAQSAIEFCQRNHR